MLSLDRLEIGTESDLDEYLAGLNVEEIADLLAVSPATVSREQKKGEAWLGRVLEPPPPLITITQ